MITIATNEPTYKPDAIAVTGLDLTEIERRIRAARMIGRAEPIGWPRDPAGLARDLLDEGDVAGFDIYQKTRHGEPGARERLTAALVAERSRRQRENDDRLERGWRDTAAIVAKGRAAGLDAVRDGVAAANRVERATTEALGAAAEFDVPRMALKGAGR